MKIQNIFFNIFLLSMLPTVLLFGKKLPEGFQLINNAPVFVGDYRVEIMEKSISPKAVDVDRRYMTSYDGQYQYFIDTNTSGNSISGVNTISVQNLETGTIKTRRWADIVKHVSKEENFIKHEVISWTISNKGLVVLLDSDHYLGVYHFYLFINNDLQVEKYGRNPCSGDEIFFIDHGNSVTVMGFSYSLSYGLKGFLSENFNEKIKSFNTDGCFPVCVDYFNVNNIYHYNQDSLYLHYQQAEKSLSIPKLNTWEPALILNDNFIFLFKWEYNKTGILVYNLPAKKLKIFSWSENFDEESIYPAFIENNYLYLTNKDEDHDERQYYRIPLHEIVERIKPASVQNNKHLIDSLYKHDCEKLPENYQLIDNMPVYVGDYQVEIMETPLSLEETKEDRRSLTSYDGLYQFFMDAEDYNPYDSHFNNFYSGPFYKINTISVKSLKTGKILTRKFEEITTEVKEETAHLPFRLFEDTYSWCISTKGIVINQYATTVTESGIGQINAPCYLFINENLKLEKYLFNTCSQDNIIFSADYGHTVSLMSQPNSISYGQHKGVPTRHKKHLELQSCTESNYVDYSNIHNIYYSDSTVYYSQTNKSLTLPKFDMPSFIMNDNFVFLNYHANPNCGEANTHKKILVYNLRQKKLKIFSWPEYVNTDNELKIEFIRDGYLYFMYTEDRAPAFHQYYRIPLDVIMGK